MTRAVLVMVLVLGSSIASRAAAQSGDGSLRGTVRDEQGAAMPGVTVTAASPLLLTPAVAVSDSVGNYRLINLPPGTYTLTAELVGFSVFRGQFSQISEQTNSNVTEGRLP